MPHKVTIALCLALVVAGKAQQPCIPTNIDNNCVCPAHPTVTQGCVVKAQSVPQCKSLSDKPCTLSVADPLHEQSVPESQRVITLDEQSLPGNEDVRLCQPDNHAPVCWDYRKSVPATPLIQSTNPYTFVEGNFFRGNPILNQIALSVQTNGVPIASCTTVSEEYTKFSGCSIAEGHTLDEVLTVVAKDLRFGWNFPSAKHHSTAPQPHASHARRKARR